MQYNDEMDITVDFGGDTQITNKAVSKLLRTIHWALYKKNVPDNEIKNFIYTATNEISMKYNGRQHISFSIGDVVDVNYGMRQEGEVIGGHVAAIVCNISSTGLAYLVPITKLKENVIADAYLAFSSPNDVIYYARNYDGGIAILDKGSYVNPKRISEVIGVANKDFLNKVLDQLASTFDFTDNV